jgi:HK97 family phage portal protein
MKSTAKKRGAKTKAAEERASLLESSGWLADALCGAPGTSGERVTETTALSLSVVWACVRVISEDIGSLPWMTYRREGEGREKASDHELYPLLHVRPNVEMSAFTLKETLLCHTLLWGNGYAEILRNRGDRVVGLYPLRPDMTKPVRKGGVLKYEVRSETGGPPAYLDSADVFHVKGLSGNGVEGYPVTRMARDSMGAAMAAEKYAGSFFGNGVTPGGMLEHPGKLGPEAQKRLRQSVEASHKGASKAHRLMILEEGMKFNRWTIPPDEAQFLETRQFHIPEVCRWFRVQPHKVADLSRATFSNIEESNLDHVSGTLRPWAIKLEQEANYKLVRPAEQGDVYTELSLDAFLRGNALGRAQSNEIKFRNGILNADEWRAQDNMNALPNGEGQRFFVPMNYVPADKVDEVIANKAKPAAPGGAVGEQLARHIAGVRAGRGDSAAEAEERRLLKLITEHFDGN